MPMVRAMRLLNAVEAGTTTGAQLQTLLTADAGRLAELNVLLGMRGQARRLFASDNSTKALWESPTALTRVLTIPTSIAALTADKEAFNRTVLTANTAAMAASSTAMNAVAASSTAMNAVIASSTAMNAVSASSTAMNAVIASSTAMNAVIESSTAMTAVRASSTAMTAVTASSAATSAISANATANNLVLGAATSVGAYIDRVRINGGATTDATLAAQATMTAVAASSTAMNAVSASSTAMNAVAASSTAMNAIYAAPIAVTAIAPTALAVHAPHTALLTLSTNNVTSWANAQGTARSFVQTTAAQQPLFNNAFPVNGYNTVNFDGIDDMLAFNGNFGTNLGTAYTAWFVYRTNASDTKGSLMGGTGTATAGGAANTDGIVLRTGALHLQESAAAAGGASRGTGYTHTAGTFGVLRVRRRATTQLHLRLNAGVESADLAGQIPAFDNTFLTLGVGNENAANGTTFLAGQLAEVFFITDGGLAGAGGETAEITRVHTMLGRKYGLYII